MVATLDSLFPDGRPVLLDGAMGSALRAAGWPAAKPSVLANIEAPDVVQGIHASHRAAGARVITTNSFSALLVDDVRCIEAVRSSVRIARRTVGHDGRVAGTVAAFGLAVDDPQLKEIVKVLVDEGVDLLVFETCNKLRDAVQALILRDEVAPHIPAVICASTTDGGKADRDRVRDIIGLVHGADDPQVEMGLNCCRGPHDALRVALAAKPVLRWVKPSTGLPSEMVDDNIMAAFARAAQRSRVRFIGGCCGTTAETLRAMDGALHEAAPRERGAG